MHMPARVERRPVRRGPTATRRFGLICEETAPRLPAAAGGDCAAWCACGSRPVLDRDHAARPRSRDNLPRADAVAVLPEPSASAGQAVSGAARPTSCIWLGVCERGANTAAQSPSTVPFRGTASDVTARRLRPGPAPTTRPSGTDPGGGISTTRCSRQPPGRRNGSALAEPEAWPGHPRAFRCGQNGSFMHPAAVARGDAVVFLEPAAAGVGAHDAAFPTRRRDRESRTQRLDRPQRAGIASCEGMSGCAARNASLPGSMRRRSSCRVPAPRRNGIEAVARGRPRSGRDCPPIRRRVKPDAHGPSHPSPTPRFPDIWRAPARAGCPPRLKAGVCERCDDPERAAPRPEGYRSIPSAGGLARPSW